MSLRGFFVLTVLVSVVVAVLSLTSEEPYVFAVDVAELGTTLGRPVAVVGEVDRSSVRSNDQTCEHRFMLRDERRLEVAAPVELQRCDPPGVRADDLEGDHPPRVSVEGIFDGVTLRATNVTPRCWSKYAADVLYMRSCYEAIGVSWDDAQASVADARASRSALTPPADHRPR